MTNKNDDWKPEWDDSHIDYKRCTMCGGTGWAYGVQIGNDRKPIGNTLEYIPCPCGRKPR